MLPNRGVRACTIGLFVIVATTQLTGCWLALLRVGGRAGASEAAMASLGRGAGGEAIAARSVAHAGVGAGLLADQAVMRSLGSSSSVLIRGPAYLERATIQAGSRQVSIVPQSGGARVRTVRKGDTATHFLGSEPNPFGFTRYSTDGRRMDFFVGNRKGTTQYVSYALRDPKSDALIFFGRNHNYLGRATVVRTAGTASSATGIGAASIGLLVFEFSERDDRASECSPEFILLRRTYYSRGHEPGDPIAFWSALREDCPGNVEVADELRSARLRSIHLQTGVQARHAALVEYLLDYPNDLDGTVLLRELEKSKGR
jgi:hypothetical protein